MRIKKFLLLLLAVAGVIFALVGVIFIIFIIIELSGPSEPNPKIIETNELNVISEPTPKIIEINRLIPIIEIIDIGQEIVNKDVSTFFAYLSNKGKDGRTLVVLNLLDKNEIPIKEYSEAHYFKSGEAKKVQFIVGTPLKMVSYKFKTELTGLIEYYSLIKNEGGPGEISVVLKLSNEKNKIVKQYSENYFFESNESKPTKFFVEYLPEITSYEFSTIVITKPIEVEEYYAFIKNEGDKGNICVLLTLLDKNNQVIKEYNKTSYLESEESKSVSFFIEIPPPIMSYEFSTMIGTC